jgi:hypothetical protein
VLPLPNAEAEEEETEGLLGDGLWTWTSQVNEGPKEAEAVCRKVVRKLSMEPKDVIR